MGPHRRVILVLMTAVLSLGVAPGPASEPAPAGEVVIAWHVTISPSWFDPSTAPPQITPFGMLYALHDALVRPLPGQKMGTSLAESWTSTPGGATPTAGVPASTTCSSRRRGSATAPNPKRVSTAF